MPIEPYGRPVQAFAGFKPSTTFGAHIHPLTGEHRIRLTSTCSHQSWRQQNQGGHLLCKTDESAQTNWANSKDIVHSLHGA